MSFLFIFSVLSVLVLLFVGEGSFVDLSGFVFLGLLAGIYCHCNGVFPF